MVPPTFLPSRKQGLLRPTVAVEHSARNARRPSGTEQGESVAPETFHGPVRQDLHNACTDWAAAVAGLCGFTHLPSGRVCLRPHRHPDECSLAVPGRDRRE